MHDEQGKDGGDDQQPQQRADLLLDHTPLHAAVELRHGGRERESRNHLNGHGMGAQAYVEHSEGVGTTTIDLLLPLLAQLMRKLQRTSDLGLYGNLVCFPWQVGRTGGGVAFIINLGFTTKSKLGRDTIAEHCCYGLNLDTYHRAPIELVFAVVTIAEH